MNAKLPLFALLSCGCAVLPLAAHAHDSPEHEIELLSEKIKTMGESADLLADRAVEYRLLGKLPEAIKDLERAVVLQPDSPVLQRELAHALYLSGKPDDALATISRGLRLKSDEPTELASLRILRADILRSKKEYPKALEDAKAAIALYGENPEWYLLRSDLQRRLKAHRERLGGLEAGIAATGAWILEVERVEALIDAGNLDAAMRTIEAELQDSRIKSSWLIRRARVRQSRGEQEAATEDLKTALAEIATRLNPKTPDVTLLLDKARALEMLGETKEALAAYKEADKGGDDSVKEKIKALEESTTKPDDPDGAAPKGK
jgi:tetratricopeptide (TPR) repeat protein